MRYGSVCSGIEAATVAWHPLGWQPAWFAEIEPFPSAVLAHHYQAVPNLGDMTTLPDRIRAGEVEAPDILCGGTPCQAFSVAGNRRSLDDARGNLTLMFLEIADAIDDVRRARGEPPCIIFWENVPGVLSTSDNAYGCFLGGLVGDAAPLVSVSRWTDAGMVAGPRRAAAWRVLDAQHFGLAQRRKRVFVVAGAGDGFDPAAVLFEFDGVRRDSAPSREAGQDAAKCLTTGTGKRFDWETEDILPVTHSIRGEGFDASEDGTGRGTPLVPVSVALRGRDGGAAACQGGSQQDQFIPPEGISPTLAHSSNAHGGHHQPKLWSGMQVRRITPIECERLMGFPDDYTAIPWRGKPADQCPDGPRYKALGNSWAVPVVRWIGQRIDQLAAGRVAA